MASGHSHSVKGSAQVATARRPAPTAIPAAISQTGSVKQALEGVVDTGPRNNVTIRVKLRRTEYFFFMVF
jgi:hypothetical protein